MMSIAEKRAILYREWLLAMLGNNEEYYFSTLYDGIPDGDDQETVLSDLKEGFYDDGIDEIINVYLKAKARYAKDGYYVKRNLYYDEGAALDAAGLSVPERI